MRRQPCVSSLLPTLSAHAAHAARCRLPAQPGFPVCTHSSGTTMPAGNSGRCRLQKHGSFASESESIDHKIAGNRQVVEITIQVAAGFPAGADFVPGALVAGSWSYRRGYAR